MKRLFPDSLAGRTIVILVIGLGLFHLWSIWIYRIGSENLLAPAREEGLAERLIAVVHVLNDVPANGREERAHALSSPGFSVHWTAASPAGDGADDHGELEPLRRRLVELAPELGAGGLHLATVAGSADHSHAILVSLRLADGTWATIRVDAESHAIAIEHDVLGSLSAMALGILVVSILLVRSLTAPLRGLAAAADRIGTGVAERPVAETGPKEIRQVARAFNDMQARIRRLLSERTQTLAAVSHDLKTPLTRLRLRAEFIPDAALRQTVDDDLDEMERMLDAALAFLRGDATGEEPRMADMGSILETICDQAADAGHDVVFEDGSQAVLSCRPLAIKRAFSNLIDNAVKYGDNVRVRLADGLNAITATIEDNGPGIPEEERERVFEPFYRIEGSRSRETGGTGLGLTLARSVVRGHGGEITLTNRDEGGLRVTVTLPKRG